MENSGLSILAVAQREYMQQLNTLMSPFILANFEKVWETAVEGAKGKNTLRHFQELLREVKNWNNSHISDASKEISDSFTNFERLIAAVFVGYVKILSSVRLTDAKKKIPIKLPSNKDFVFKVYEEAAKAIYKDPYWFQEDITDDDKIENMLRINEVGLDKVLKALVPINLILETYMSTARTDEDMEVESQVGDPDDVPDPEAISGEQGEDPVGANVPGEQGEDPMNTGGLGEEGGEPMEDNTGVEEDDVKNITVGGKPGAEAGAEIGAEAEAEDMEDEPDDGVLFPGAPESRIKT